MKTAQRPTTLPTAAEKAEWAEIDRLTGAIPVPEDGGSANRIAGRIAGQAARVGRAAALARGSE